MKKITNRSSGGRDNLDYTLIDDGVDFEIIACIGNVEVGLVRCDRDGDQLILADICVSKEQRRQGIGGELLKRLIIEADRVAIGLIFGSITPDAIREQPFLLGWYERHGFRVMPADGQCLRGAVNKIVRERESWP